MTANSLAGCALGSEIRFRERTLFAACLLVCALRCAPSPPSPPPRRVNHAVHEATRTPLQFRNDANNSESDLVHCLLRPFPPGVPEPVARAAHHGLLQGQLVSVLFCSACFVFAARCFEYLPLAISAAVVFGLSRVLFVRIGLCVALVLRPALARSATHHCVD
jgi:hypothetical protein